MSQPEGLDAAGARLAEQTIVSRAQEGDLASFEVLLRQYQGPLFRLANRMLLDRSDAEDVVQDTMVLVWRRLPTLSDPALFRGWLYQIATRRCLAVLRTRTRRQTSALGSDELQQAHDEAHTDDPRPDDPASAAQFAAQLRGLDAVLQTLTAEQRACWVLREMHDLTYMEIAYAMDLPVSAVRGRIARARQNLLKGMATWR
ncbi:MAG TPA: sigma-70 family RNA polymerase sigma factor [Propionibacteriaceae bacterium]